MKIKSKATIIAAFITATGTIVGAVVGGAWQKNNLNITVQLDGKSIVLKDSDVQEVVAENEELKEKISGYESQIETMEDVKNENDYLIEFENLGLSIEGEEKTIEKDKSSVLIDGVRYYSQDIINNLLPINTSISVENNMLYVGKKVKEKTSLYKQPIIDKGFDVFIYNNVSNTYGNVYNEAVIFQYNGCYIVFNAGMEYSNFKCTVSMEEGNRYESILQIEADDQVVYTSDKITCQTAPFEIEIPINMASRLTIRTMGESGGSGILISDGILYNEK